MQKYLLLSITILCATGSAFFILPPAGSLSARPAVSELEKTFPTLGYQLQSLRENAPEGDAIRPEKLQQLLTHLYGQGSVEMRKGLSMVLLEDVYRKHQALENLQVRLDGKASEWEDTPYMVRDPRGDVSVANADLIDFRAYLDADYNLNVMYKTAAKPANKPGEEGYVLAVRKSFRAEHRLEFAINYRGRSNFYNYANRKNKVRKMISFSPEYRIGQVAEAKIELGKIFDKHGIKRTGKLWIHPYIAHKRVKNGHDFSRAIWIHRRLPNHALELLAHLLLQGKYRPGETMPVALALANNYLYSIADGPTRAAIKRDIVRHYDLYREIVAWQKSLPIKIRLDQAPVLPQFFWANRRSHSETDKGVLTLRYYREFIDKISSLRKARQFVLQVEAAKSDSMAALIPELEKIADRNTDYRAAPDYLFNRYYRNNPEMQKVIRAEIAAGKLYTQYFGRRRRWDGFAWLNYQIKRFEEQGRFRGDCGTYTMLQMAMFRAAGIPVIGQHIRSKDGAYGHAYPSYYDFFIRRRRSLQKPRAGDPKVVRYLYGKRPYHHTLYEAERERFGRDLGKVYAPRVFIPAGRVYDLHVKGWPLAHFEKIFHDPQKQIARHFFAGSDAPDRLADTDDDGIVDIEERKLGLRSDLSDTDGDGLADLWEIEHGYPANDDSEPSRAELFRPAMDGLAQTQAEALRLPAVQDPRGDVRSTTKEIFDIATVYAQKLDDELYLAVTFHNDIRKNRNRMYTFDIMAHGKEAKRFWFQWNGDQVYPHRFKDPSRWGVERIKDNRGFKIMVARDAEFMIPMRHFQGAEQLEITFHGAGHYKGKNQILDDHSKRLKLSLGVTTRAKGRVKKSDMPAEINPHASAIPAGALPELQRTSLERNMGYD